MGDGVYCSRSRLIIIGVTWLLITLAIGLMAGLLSTHQCPDEDGASPPPGESTTSPATTTTIPIPGQPWTNPFLPNKVTPLHYDMWFYPDFYYDGDTFQGRENVTIHVGEDTRHLLIHYKLMNITRTMVWDEAGQEIPIERTFAFDDNQYWVVECQDIVEAPRNVTLYLEFSGSLTNGIVGYYKSTYTNTITGVESWLATTKFQPTDARKAFPNFDEPKFKATFSITLQHWRNFTALSNMPDNGTVDIDSVWRETIFETTPVMSSYLVCFIVSDFEYKENILANGKRNRVWASPDKINNTFYALEVSKKLSDYMEEEFNMTYHLPKLDHFAVPDYPSGATEHWGLITYRENRLLFDPEESSEDDKRSVASIVSHELAHNYFGNVITCHWWNDIWLNEGFASFYEDKALGAIGEYEAMDEFVIRSLQPIMEFDAEAESRAVTENVTHPDEINAAFSGVIYSKGASLLRMVEEFMGEEAFRTAIRKYLKTFEYSTVITADLWNALSEEMPGVDIATVMNPWVEQMGLPVVNVTQVNGTMVRATQERFLNDPDAPTDQPPSQHNYKWFIPLTYRSAEYKNTTSTVWMNQSDVSVDDPRRPGDWLQANVKQFGFYRVNYQEDMWAALAEELQNSPETFDAVDRAAILDDAFNLARATKLDYPTVLNLTSYLERESHFYPWTSSSSALTYISTMLINSGDYVLWRDYIRDLTGPIMNELGVQDDGRGYTDTVNRDDNIIPLACGHGHVECMANTTRIFLDWINDDTYYISPNIRLGVYKYGMQQAGTDDTWETTWQRYTAATGQEQSNLAYCLAQPTKRWLIQRYLDYAMDPTLIRTQDFFTVVNYMANNLFANRHVWDWTREHYDELVERFGTQDRYFGRMVPNMVYHYNTATQLQEVEDFYMKYPDAGAGAQSREESLTSIRSNIAWVMRNRQPIIDWLKAR